MTKPSRDQLSPSFFPPYKIQTLVQNSGIQFHSSIHCLKPKSLFTSAFRHGELSRIHLRNRTGQGRYRQHPMVTRTELTRTSFERSTVHFTTRLALVATVIAALENTSSPRTRKLFSSPTSTRTPPMTPKIR